MTLSTSPVRYLIVSLPKQQFFYSLYNFSKELAMLYSRVSLQLVQSTTDTLEAFPSVTSEHCLHPFKSSKSQVDWITFLMNELDKSQVRIILCDTYIYKLGIANWKHQRRLHYNVQKTQNNWVFLNGKNERRLPKYECLVNNFILFVFFWENWLKREEAHLTSTAFSIFAVLLIVTLIEIVNTLSEAKVNFTMLRKYSRFTCIHMVHFDYNIILINSNSSKS